VTILYVNGDSVALTAEAMPELVEGRRRIAFWWWELLDALPDSWRSAFDHLDEIWVGSEHVLKAVAPHSPLPVVNVRLPVTVPPPAPLDAHALGLPDGFVFLFFFDFFSGMGRKNPVGLIRAFRDAFAPGSGVSLVIKSTNGDSFPERVELLRETAAGHPDVHLLEGYLEPRARAAMLAHADCYVSLHRSEGFGLPLAEAMFLGKPVIATAYGGNLDFMNRDNSWLVEHGTAQVGDSGALYPSEAVWAEPDLEQAGRAMREVVAAPADAAARAARGGADIRRTHSITVVGELMKRQLERGPTGRLDELPGARDRLRVTREWITEGDTPKERERTRGVRGYARQLALRLMRPYIAYQTALNQWFLQLHTHTMERIETLELLHAESLSQIRTLRRQVEDLSARLDRSESRDRERP
jgi:glycosyltransferase involved in cell wall biosynthesis